MIPCKNELGYMISNSEKNVKFIDIFINHGKRFFFLIIDHNDNLLITYIFKLIQFKFLALENRHIMSEYAS